MPQEITVLENVLEHKTVPLKLEVSESMKNMYDDLKGQLTDQEFLGHLLFLHEENY